MKTMWLFGLFMLCAGLNAANPDGYSVVDVTTQETKVIPTATGIPLGSALALSGNTLVVDAPDDEAVYVFVRQEDDTWQVQQRLADERMGPQAKAVAIDGDTLVIGEPEFIDDGMVVNKGRILVYRRNGTTWELEQELRGVAESNVGDLFGSAIDLVDNRMLVGAPGREGTGEDANRFHNYGAAYTLVRSGSTWTREGPTLRPTDPGDRKAQNRFGIAVALNDTGDQSFVSSLHAHGGRGLVVQFTRNGSVWTQQDLLQGSESADFFGCSLALDGTSLLIGAYGSDPGSGTKTGAVKVYTAAGTTWSLSATLGPGEGFAATLDFGFSVDISGDLAIVGSEDSTSSGTVFLFVRNGNSWGPPTAVTSNYVENGDLFGVGVVTDGSRHMVSAERSGDVLHFVGLPAVESAPIRSVQMPDQAAFGTATAISGDTLAVSAPGDGGGAVYVYVRDSGEWTLQQRISPEDGYEFGVNLALDGNTLLVGEPRASGLNALYRGRVMVYRREGDRWDLEQEITAPNASAFDLFGSSVALVGDLAVIGVTGRPGLPQDVNQFRSYGMAFVYRRSGATWTPQGGPLVPANAGDRSSGNEFGHAVAINDSGTQVFVSTWRYDNGRGAVFVFEKSGANWAEVQQIIGGSGDRFGSALAIDDDSLLIGATTDDSGSATETGSVFVFTDDGSGSWVDTGRRLAPDARHGKHERFGTSLAISGDIAIVGSHDTRNSSTETGMAYLFSRSGNTWSSPVEVTPVDGANGNFFGQAVATDGIHYFIGSPQSDTDSSGATANNGAVYIYRIPSNEPFREIRIHTIAGFTWIIEPGETALPTGAGMASFTQLDPSVDHLLTLLPENLISN